MNDVFAKEIKESGIPKTIVKQQLDAAKGKRFVMVLIAEGNPNYSQYAPIAKSTIIGGQTSDELKRLATEYIDNNELGGGNWGFPIIFEGENRTPVARMSYNRRLWEVAISGSLVPTEIN